MSWSSAPARSQYSLALEGFILLRIWKRKDEMPIHPFRLVDTSFDEKVNRSLDTLLSVLLRRKRQSMIPWRVPRRARVVDTP